MKLKKLRNSKLISQNRKFFISFIELFAAIIFQFSKIRFKISEFSN